jgi:hypothetical protein
MKVLDYYGVPPELMPDSVLTFCDCSVLTPGYWVPLCRDCYLSEHPWGIIETIEQLALEGYGGRFCLLHGPQGYSVTFGKLSWSSDVYSKLNPNASEAFGENRFARARARHSGPFSPLPNAHIQGRMLRLARAARGPD